MDYYLFPHRSNNPHCRIHIQAQGGQVVHLYSSDSEYYTVLPATIVRCRDSLIDLAITQRIFAHSILLRLLAQHYL